MDRIEIDTWARISAESWSSLLLGNGASIQVGARGVLLWVPPRRRATAMGLRQTGNMLGAALAAVALPGVAQWLGWRTAVLLVAAVAAIADASPCAAKLRAIWSAI